jgi:phosphoribosylformylglycinamidine cyclo-ligase
LALSWRISCAYSYQIMSNSSAPTVSPLSYKAAGVDIDAGDALVERIKPLAKRTMREGVLGGIGGFGALFEIPKRYKEPVLVSGTDGVGTKLKLAFEWNMHDTVGIDLVAMSVNDVLVQGAEPLFFLDYFACGKLDVDTAAAVIGGIAKGCELSGCALIGGETAEMPGMYPAGEYDLAGFCVGAAEKSKLLPRPDVKAGDVILGLTSSGVHSNGFSLVRKCVERAGASAPEVLDGMPFKEALMKPTRLYVKNVLSALALHNIKALAHITGGGLIENIPRVLPEGLAAQLKKGSWPQTELFAWLQKTAGIDDFEMNRTFNNGIGMIVVVDAVDAVAVSATLSGLGEQVHVIGQMVARSSDAVVIA